MREYSNGSTSLSEIVAWFRDNSAIVAVVAAVLLAVWAIGTRQSALNLEESVHGAKSIISINQNTMHQKIPAMVQLIERGAEQERATLTAYAQARAGLDFDQTLNEVTSLNENGDVEGAYTKFMALVEAVPELTSIHGYNDVAKELSLAHNNIKDAQINLVTLTTNYRQLVRGFPASLLLRLALYQVDTTCMEYLDFGAAVEAPVTFNFAPITN